MKTLQALFVLLPSLYLLVAVLFGMAFGGRRAPVVERPRRLLLWLTLALHAATFALRWRAIGGFPIDDTWTTLSSVAFALAFLWAWVARYTGHPGTGGIVLGLCFLLQLSASAFVSYAPPVRPPQQGLFPLLHIGTSVIAASALVLSGVHGALYLIVFRRLRQRRFGSVLEHLPDLDLLARMTRRSALAGFLFSTVGLNLGIALAHARGVQGFDYLDPHVLLTLVLWIHFGVIAFSGWIRGITARRASFAAAAGLLVLLASLFLTLFPTLTFHSTP